MPTMQDARRWLERWDRQQEYYMADREERFAVVADVVIGAIQRPDPLIVDLGAGPGSLSVRLLDRIPHATVVAVDADPLLLGLARAAYGDRPGLRIVDHDLREPGWVQALELPGHPDAFVSTTALHWLTRASSPTYTAAAARWSRRAASWSTATTCMTRPRPSRGCAPLPSTYRRSGRLGSGAR